MNDRKRVNKRFHQNTHRLGSLNGDKPVVALLSTNVTEGPVVPGVLGNVANFMDRMLMLEYLDNGGRDQKLFTCYREERTSIARR